MKDVCARGDAAPLVPLVGTAGYAGIFDTWAGDGYPVDKVALELDDETGVGDVESDIAHTGSPRGLAEW